MANNPYHDIYQSCANNWWNDKLTHDQKKSLLAEELPNRHPSSLTNTEIVYFFRHFENKYK